MKFFSLLRLPTPLFVGTCITLLFVGLCGCRDAETYPNRPITLICPWAAGGGTDRVSRQMAAHLEQELGVPVNVVNATGGKGVTGHSRGITAKPDGYTLAMITLELNTMHWIGLTELTYEDCIPLYSVNEDYAALYVRTDATWNSLAELEKEIQANPGKLKASGTASGGAWHLGIVGWLLASGMGAEDVTWISSTGSGPSLQELISGGLDMVCCSLPEARALLEAGQVRALGLMAPVRALGFEEVATFREQGTEWTLGAWRGLAVPLGTPDEKVARLKQAIGKIVRGETRIASSQSDAGTTFPEFMETQRFDHNFRTDEALQAFLSETDAKFEKLLTSDAMRTVNADRHSPMIFPNILFGLMACVLIGIVGISLRKQAIQTTSPLPPSESLEQDVTRNYSNFGLLVGAVLVYLLLVEMVGFVLLSMLLVFVMLYWLGTRGALSIGIAIVFVPAVYQLFANFLRVPLPRGWWGW